MINLEPKYCKDCKHVRKVVGGHGCYLTASTTINLVTGKATTVYVGCDRMREDNLIDFIIGPRCGKRGRLWELYRED